MDEELILMKRLEALRIEHRELDLRIEEEELDEFTRKKLQKTKLVVRDAIADLERTLYPDIIA